VGDNLPLIFINWKSRHMGTHRNTGDAWLREIRPGNPLWMNSADARARNIKEGDRVLVKSVSGQIEAQVYLTEGIKPGVVGADFSFGHTAYGSRPVEIDGQVIAPVAPYGHTPFNFAQPWHEEAGLAQGRGTGFNVNLLARLDDTLKNTPLTDPIGGGASSLDTRVEVVKLG
ncbi:MAG: tetrathionate reductase subunit A, partial [Firmicutes bacterium]|nr:tetrathionate reductase subunit A [Bacillota bacterium]